MSGTNLAVRSHGRANVGAFLKFVPCEGQDMAGHAAILGMRAAENLLKKQATLLK